MEGLASYIVRRLLWIIPVLVVVSFATFAIARLGPGDPVRVRAGQFTDEEALARVRAQYGLDKPIWEQYWIYVRGALTEGDLGESFRYQGRSVVDVILPKVWVSAQLNLVALLVTFALGVPVGMYAATRQGSWQDPMAIGTFLLFRSIPSVVIVPIAIWLLVVELGWMRLGWNGVFSRNALVPILALSIPGVAGVARLVRATTLDALTEDYVRTARAKGLSEMTVLTRHVARNALLPLVTIFGLSLVTVLEGSFFVETLWGIPGAGRLAFESVNDRDYDLLLALVLMIAVAFMVINIVVDVAYAFIDPRVRISGRGAHA